ncbi:metalloregulator ArsR/SmtB family transcription factor [Polaromonas sp. SM01]|uniref:metalloregulator ArsR/SmtB family transcription factor n=1 Tax=Polaromonas sp. SM01 TaxID=3085630 RepID=UPI0029826910|nr:metalloregulator ArsR/SmtB family transcription factor [Polaromonas sp. SM01]MDW5444328.1 metalloregulator ArsR/SmtB family transcription factor [Polaromonas sp. SM01]
MKGTTETLDLQAMQRAATQASGLLRALANPDRLLLLCQLAQGEHCVSELEGLLGILQPTLSQQLGVLRQEGLVTTRREGKQIFYSMASPEALAVMQVLYQQFCEPTSGDKR